MSVGQIFRLIGKLALAAAIAALLLQSACTIGPAQLAAAGETTGSAHSGCHESAPATPHAPDSGQKCCNGKHSPEALITAVVITPTPLVSTKFVVASSFNSSDLYQRAAEILSTPAGPPGPVVLRI